MIKNWTITEKNYMNNRLITLCGTVEYKFNCECRLLDIPFGDAGFSKILEIARGEDNKHLLILFTSDIPDGSYSDYVFLLNRPWKLLKIDVMNIIKNELKVK